jgi:hypothetical protein
MLLGGTNGLTNFSKSLTQNPKYIVGLYVLTLVVLGGAYLLCRAITRSRLGRVLVAIRDKETRLYFAGYKPYAFKVFAFAVGAMIAAVGGMLYVPQVTIISPHNMRVEESIMMVIWVALGGRGRLWGAILGALVVNCTYSAITSDMPTTWPFIQGLLFVSVVLLFPDGFVGMWDKVEDAVRDGRGLARAALAAVPLAAVGLFVLAEATALMPGALRAVVIDSQTVGKVQLKYLVLVCLLLALAMTNWALRRAARPAAVGAGPLAVSHAAAGR